MDRTTARVRSPTRNGGVGTRKGNRGDAFPSRRGRGRSREGRGEPRRASSSGWDGPVRPVQEVAVANPDLSCGRLDRWKRRCSDTPPQLEDIQVMGEDLRRPEILAHLGLRTSRPTVGVEGLGSSRESSAVIKDLDTAIPKHKPPRTHTSCSRPLRVRCIGTASNAHSLHFPRRNHMTPNHDPLRACSEPHPDCRTGIFFGPRIVGDGSFILRTGPQPQEWRLAPAT